MSASSSVSAAAGAERCENDELGNVWREKGGGVEGYLTTSLVPKIIERQWKMNEM